MRSVSGLDNNATLGRPLEGSADAGGALPIWVGEGLPSIRGIDRALPSLMSSFHLAHHFLDGHVSLGEEVSQETLNVRTTQQRMALQKLLLQHEEHRHHHQGHVVMPGKPAAHLIVSQAALALGILERALDPKPLPLHLDNCGCGMAGREVSQLPMVAVGSESWAGHAGQAQGPELLACCGHSGGEFSRDDQVRLEQCPFGDFS